MRRNARLDGILFNTAYYVAKKEGSFVGFGHLVLQKKIGPEVGEQYANWKACREFAHVIAKKIESILLNPVELAHFLSLMVYLSCDVTMREHCNLFVCLVDAVTNTALNRLLSTPSKLTGTTTEDYLSAVHKALEGTPRWREK